MGKLAVLLILPALVVAGPSPHTCRLVDAIPFFNFNKERSSIEDTQDLTLLTEFARFMNHKVPSMLEEFAHLKNILNIGQDEDIQPGKDLTAANLRMPKQLDYETEIKNLFDMTEALTRQQQSKLFFSKPETTTTTTETPDEGEDNAIKASIKKVVKKVVDSMKEVVETIKTQPLSVSSIKSIFAGIIDGIKKTLNDANIPVPGIKPTEAPVDKPDPEEPSFFAKWPQLRSVRGLKEWSLKDVSHTLLEMGFVIFVLENTLIQNIRTSPPPRGKPRAFNNCT